MAYAGNQRPSLGAACTTAHGDLRRDRLQTVFLLGPCGLFHIPASVTDLECGQNSVRGIAMTRSRPARRKIAAAIKLSEQLGVRYAEVLQLRRMILDAASAKPQQQPQHVSK